MRQIHLVLHTVICKRWNGRSVVYHIYIWYCGYKQSQTRPNWQCHYSSNTQQRRRPSTIWHCGKAHDSRNMWSFKSYLAMHKWRKMFEKDTKGISVQPSTGDDTFLKHRWLSPDERGYEATITKLTIGGVVPYNKLLLKIIDAHLNIKLCSSVESIKNVIKYINKSAIRLRLANNQLTKWKWNSTT